MNEGTRARMAAMEHHLELLARQLMDPEILSQSGRYREISRDHAHTAMIVAAWHAWLGLEAELAGAREMLQDDEADVRALARDEIRQIGRASCRERV